jgi:predicted transcriptional regulator
MSHSRRHTEVQEKGQKYEATVMGEILGENKYNILNTVSHSHHSSAFCKTHKTQT